MIAAFTATHVPPSEVPPHYPVPDVLLHFVGFVVLGMVTIWRMSGGGVRVGHRAAILWTLGLVAYGLVDEATQPLVGRAFQWTDWLADGSGAVVGALGAMICGQWTLKSRS